MDQLEIRTLTGQLADDLTWLEKHSREQAGKAAQASALHLAAAMVRNLVGPFLENQPPLPLHLAVVGGAGTGKSTVANMLSGSILAEANPQAGFTRHPIAYTPANGQITWPGHAGFLGSLQRLTKPTPSSLDEDVYQIRRVPGEAGVLSLLEHFVIWDCPDMTTWASGNYITRLLEVAGLADVIFYVASDERYNDEVPTEYLKLFLKAGKLVIVCLTKMRETDAPALLAHFRQEVLAKMHDSRTACVYVPHLTQQQLADPIHAAAAHRIPLLNQVGVLTTSPAATRTRAVRSAVEFLHSQQDMLLGVAKGDLDSLKTWQHLVRDGRYDFESRYRKEFLDQERFRRFDEALVKLLELLELPGVGKVLSTTLTVLRTPYRLLKGLFNKAMQRPPSTALPEKPVLEGALNSWLDSLRKEAARRAETSAFWKHIDKGFAAGLGQQVREQFDKNCKEFELNMNAEVERTARSIYEDLEKSPVALNTLRGSKFAIEIAAITSTLIAGGINVFDIVLVPLAASVTHHLVELLGRQYVDSQREQARERQQTLVAQHLAAPLADWLAHWPATGGSTFERLQLILQRLPGNIRTLNDLVAAKIQQTAPVATATQSTSTQ